MIAKKPVKIDVGAIYNVPVTHLILYDEKYQYFKNFLMCF